VYGREYDGQTLRFEASGGLLHSALVLRDKETDSFWSIMTGTSLAGDLAGTSLNELPLGEKAQWKDWVAQHPDTRVLSVDGVEHVDNSPYDNYLGSDEGFRGAEASDKRLPTKASIYSFHLRGTPYAVPQSDYPDGEAFDLGDGQIFLYRPADAAVYYSTRAWQSSGFERRGDSWYDRASGARFDPARAAFADANGKGPKPLEGFDTFWYNWSLTNPQTQLIRGKR
jgi:hypothetical protein